MKLMEDIKAAAAQIYRYQPLICVVGIAALAASAITSKDSLGRLIQKIHHPWMHSFMGLFFCQFSMLKLFDIKGFKEGFSKYDLITTKFPIYGFIYPFIELALGLGYLSYFRPILIYILTFLFMTVGTASVIRALKKGLDVKCACLGTVLNVPLSSITIIEDVTMGLMAFFLLIVH